MAEDKEKDGFPGDQAGSGPDPEPVFRFDFGSDSDYADLSGLADADSAFPDAAGNDSAPPDNPRARMARTRAVSTDMAIRLWLDHYTSHIVPSQLRDGPRYSSVEEALEKMLLEEGDPIYEPSGREYYIPPPDPSRRYSANSPLFGEDGQSPVWRAARMDGNPEEQAETDRHLALLVSNAERQRVAPVLAALLADDPAGFSDATGLPLDALLDAIGD